MTGRKFGSSAVRSHSNSTISVVTISAPSRPMRRRRSVDNRRRESAMIVALLGQHGSVGKTTPVPHFTSQSSRQGKQIALIDADPQDSTVDWFEQPAPSPVRPSRRRHTGARRRIAIAAFPRRVSIPDNRVVFNIKGNDYRLVVKINYPYRVTRSSGPC